MRKLTKEAFIERGNTVHGDKYDYSQTDYVNSKIKVTIICPKHGAFEQNPTSHLNGCGCPICAGMKRKSTKLSKRLSYTEAKKMIQNFHIRTALEWGEKYDSIIKNLNIPKFPETAYANEGWVGWPEFLNSTFINNKNREFLDFNEARDFARQQNIKSGSEWNNFAKTNIFPDNIPKDPRSTYKNSGWISMGDWLGTGYVNHKDREYISFIEAKDYVKNLNIKTSAEWELNKEIPTNIPKSPSKYYNIEWMSWPDFLGTNVGYNGIFTKPYKLQLLNELQYSDLKDMDPIELSIIIGQGNLPTDFGVLVNSDPGSNERIATLEELKERFSTQEDSEELPIITSTIETSDNELRQEDDVDNEIMGDNDEEQRLPSVNIVNELQSLDNSLYATMDEEAFESLIQYKLRKLWNQVLNSNIELSTLETQNGGKYFNIIKEQFINEYNIVSKYQPVSGYSFKYEPNLMQKLTVHRLIKNHYYGNWSGTGAGKTLSFIIASREIDAKVTLVIALNSTIKQTANSIKEVYPDSVIYTDYKENFVFDRSKHNYLILNYEKFQQEYSEELCQSITNNNQIDLIVVDEVHSVKQRQEDNESIRHSILNRMFGRIRENNPNVYTLVMSATPVINTLYEAKSLLKLMTGLDYDDVKTTRNVPNALNIFQQLILNGIRFTPKYDISVNELTGHNMSNLNIDGSHLLNDLLSIPQQNYLEAEKLLLDDKLNAIKPYLRKGVIIYTYFTTGIVNKIESFVRDLGFKVGTYTGDETTFFRDKNLNDFINGKIDILIGSKPIGTGVDGLQNVCDRMILITLPWTDSEYTQLKGRIYRQGSIFDNVEFIIPQVKIQLEENEIWSWDIQRLNLIKNKKTLADCAVDGIIPSKILPSPETMYRKSIESLDKWKERINNGNIISGERTNTIINLYPEITNPDERRKRIESEINDVHRRANTSLSSTTHREFTDNPDLWFRYHTLRKERMEQWDEIPYEYIASKIKNKNQVIADFGCGENKFKDCLHNKVYSFDHIAFDDSVTACDMKNTPLGNESIDVAVFSLSLWGVNYEDYIKESYRILNYGGIIYIAEPAKSYNTPELRIELKSLLTNNNFEIVGDIEDRGKFIYIKALK